MVLVCHGEEWFNCRGRDLILLVHVEDITYMGDRCGVGHGGVGVCIPVVGMSVLRLSELVCIVNFESNLMFELVFGWAVGLCL